MSKENQPTTHPESIVTWPWRKFSGARWQTKALILTGLSLIIATA